MTDTNCSLENINEQFKIPIRYNSECLSLNETVTNDLELVKTCETEESPIYHNVFNPTDKASQKIVEQFATHYTTDTAYLKETQKYIASLPSTELNTILNKYNLGAAASEIDDIVVAWEEITTNPSFREKYLYIDWTFAKELNNNPSFLQIMSIYNIASPILSLCLPIFVLIIPFFIIKVKGIQLNLNEYIEILKTIIANNAVFKVFTQFHQADTGQKAYLIISAAFYLFSIYQNMLVCIRFYSNMKKIHTYLFQFRTYLDYTIQLMKYHSTKTGQLTKYGDFNNELMSKVAILEQLYSNLTRISPFQFSLFKFTEIGHIMYTFYQLYDNNTYKEAMLYSFGFHGYFKMMCQLADNVHSGKMSKCTYLKKDMKPVFKKMYYPKFINEQNDKIVKNDCSLNKNMILTGPNASGKTTTLKTALINIILSQQFGYGCYHSLKMHPYQKFHSYLNIPDTSARDSLFQAEARRCKDIIDTIDESGDEHTHFCIFDELYSGTNPKEAVTSASAFMEYIVKKANITCLLTTHYIALCKKLSKNDKIKNHHMKVLDENGEFHYTYLIQPGISKIKGGLKVLQDMNYPKEILNKI